MQYKKRSPLTLLFVLILPCNLFCQDPHLHRLTFRNTRIEAARHDVASWHFRMAPVFEAESLISVGSGRLTFHGSQGESLDLPDGYVATEFSRDGSNFAIISLISSQETDEHDAVRIQVYSTNGRQRFELTHRYAYDEPLPAVTVLNGDRGVILGNSFIGRLGFYGRRGRLIQDIALFPNSDADLEKGLMIAASGNAGLVAVLGSKGSASPIEAGAAQPSGEPTVFAFTEQGQEIWREVLPESSPGHLSVSPDGEFLLASCYSSDSEGNIRKATIILDGDGEEIKEYDFLFRMAGFSGDSKTLIMANRSVAMGIDLPSGRKLWEQKTPGNRGIIAAVATGIEFEPALILLAQDEFREGGFVFTKPTLLALDSSGNQIQVIDFSGSEFKQPSLFQSSDDKRFGVGFRDRFMFFELNN